MKTNIVSIFLLLILFSSCNDEFMERLPEDEFPDVAYWKTENDLIHYTNGFYNNYLATHDFWDDLGNFTRDKIDGSDTQPGTEYDRYFNGERTVKNDDYNWSFRELRDYNYFLQNYERVEIDEDIKAKYKAEALFFRSSFYFEKVVYFGDVLFIDVVLNMGDEKIFGGRDSRHMVIDRIIKDLEIAAETLPSIRDNSWTGRINRETALLLLARIALFEGTWEKYHKGTVFGVEGEDGTIFLKKAAEATEELISSGILDLDNKDNGKDDGYWKLFNQTDLSNSKEVLLWRKYSREENQYHIWGRFTRNGIGTGLSKTLVDSYLDIEGNPISLSAIYKGDKTIKDVVTNRDPRLKQTMYVNDGTHLRTDSKTEPDITRVFVCPTFKGQEERCATGYQMYKGHNPNHEEYFHSQSTTAHIYFRYAEALLINAEAKAELEIITQNDVDKTINQLRARVGMPNLYIAKIAIDPNWQFPNLSPIINEIRRERMIEFACEGFRTNDILRWAAADELIVGKRPLGAKRAQWDELFLKDDSESKAIVIEYLGDEESFKDTFPINEEGYIDPYQKNLPEGYNFNLNRDYLYPIPTREITLSKGAIKQNPGW